MRNCQKCRPCCGNQGWNNGRCCKEVEVIVEPTVHCCTEQHHHKCVRHIVPIVYHQAHHHHKHHEYVVKRKHTHEHRHHEHGRFDGDWCEKDSCGLRGGLEDGLKNEDFSNMPFGRTSEITEEQYV